VYLAKRGFDVLMSGLEAATGATRQRTEEVVGSFPCKMPAFQHVARKKKVKLKTIFHELGIILCCRY
jgi:hypothetical protein